MMTIKELIEKLSVMPPETVVRLDNIEGYYEDITDLVYVEDDEEDDNAEPFVIIR